MKKPVKWTLIGLGIFVFVAVVVVIIIFVGSAVFSVAVEGIKKASTIETKQIEKSETTVAEITAAAETTGPALMAGQEFIYNGLKISLTKYEIMETNIGKNELWIYLYVKNVGNDSRSHIYPWDFYIYYNERKGEPLLNFADIEGAKKMYDVGSYDKINPGEICEGWTSQYIPIDWKAENIDIRLEPLFGGTRCIWKFK